MSAVSARGPVPLRAVRGLIALALLAVASLVPAAPAVAATQPDPPPASAAPQQASCDDWHHVPLPADREGELTAVAASADNNAWAVGHIARVSVPDPGPIPAPGGGFAPTPVTTFTAIAERWDGRSWTRWPLGLPPGESTQLSGVAVLARDDAWAVGARGAEGSRRTLIEHWDGSRWRVVESPSPYADNVLTAVTAFTPTDVWAVGQRRASSSGSAVPLVLHFDGQAWTEGAAPSAPRGAELLGVAGRGPTDLWTVGGRTVIVGELSRRTITLAAHFDGTAWTSEPSDSPGDSAELRAVTVTPGGPLAAGWSRSLGAPGAPGQYQTLVERRDDSGAWRAEPTSTSGRLGGVSSTRALDWAVGVDGDRQPLILKKADGEPWGRVAAPSAGAGTEGRLNAVATMPGGGGWAVGTWYRPGPSGVVYRPLIERVCGADLEVTGTVTPATAAPGETFTYTLAVANHGPHVAASVDLTAELDPRLSVTGARPSQGSCRTRGRAPPFVECSFGQLRSGESATVTVTALAERTGRGLLLTASASNEGIEDPNPENNTESLEVDVVGTVPCDGNWRVVPSAPDVDEGRLHAVAAGPDGEVWAVGGGQYDSDDVGLRPMAQRWDGRRWTSAPVESPDNQYENGELFGVTVVGRDDAWAVGRAGGEGEVPQPLIERWDGEEWRIVPGPTLAGGGLNAVTAFSADDVWAVGAQIDVPSRRVSPLVMHYNGTAWSVVPGIPPPPGDTELFGVTGNGPRDLWAVGGDATIPQPDPDPGPDIDDGGIALLNFAALNDHQEGVGTFVVHFDGTRWTRERSDGAGSPGALRAAALPAGGPIAVGVADPDGQPRQLIERRRTARGAPPTWSLEGPNPGREPGRLLGTARASNGAWAVGSSPDGEGAKPVLRRSFGATWQTAPPPDLGSGTYAELAGVTVASLGDVWAVGRVGDIPLIVRLCGTDLQLTGRASPDPGKVGQPLTYALTVRNLGEHDAPNVTLAATLDPSMRLTRATSSRGDCGPATGSPPTLRCSLGTLRSNQTTNVTITVTPSRAGQDIPFTATVSAPIEEPDLTNNTARVAVDVVAIPKLAVDPALGPPGFVARATGTGFPTSTRVTLTWRPGLGVTRVTTRPDGTFTAWVLILPGDSLGQRQLEARSVGPSSEPDATAEFLVVPAPQQPSRFVSRS